MTQPARGPAVEVEPADDATSGAAMRALERALPGDSEMARRMRALDWSQTSLGPIEQWPQSLLTSISTCLDCAFPIVIWWGPELTILYNDEYVPILGPAKHPAALGQRGSVVWAEIWNVIGPMLSHVMQHAEATRSRDLLLHINRGYLEEAYFSFSYSPIHAEQGKVGGIFCPVIETTHTVLGQRRLRTLRDLAAECQGAGSEQAAYASAAKVLAANPWDLPFAMIYRVDQDRSLASLEASAGIEAVAEGAPSSVVLGPDANDIWSLGAVASSGEAAMIFADSSKNFAALPSGAWQVPVRSVLVLPVLLPGRARPRAILVAAVSPMRFLDDDYRTFFELIATQIAAGLADAQALQEERRRAEALAEIDRAKTAFFSNVSHEFRTPLTLMLGPLEEVIANVHGALPEDAAAALTVAHRNSLRLLKLVNTLLDFSRIEAGRIDASYEPVDLSAYTAELASVFRSAVEKAELQLIVDCPALPQPVYVDRDMWEKVVLNLLSNAFKFTFAGSIRVALRWRAERVDLSVSDSGVGIPSAALPKIFERFYRVKNARSRSNEGTGIGLALVQELARLHGGTVNVESVEGHGATFIVSIPTGSAHLPAERVIAAAGPATPGIRGRPFVEEALRWLPERGEAGDMGEAGVPAGISGAPARILIADDNADMREYLRRLLERHYAVESVADGEAALERIRANAPDLVLTDVMMPRMDGFDLLAAIRADEATRSVPVILLSARAGEEASIEGLKAGADAYLIKPFAARELLARIASQLELARLRREAEQALRYRGEQYATLLNQAPMGVFLVDADFCIREVNPIAQPVFDGISGGVLGRGFDEIMHSLWEKEYADELVRIYRRTLETGESYVMPERARYRIDRGVTEYYEWQLHRITLPDGRFGLVCYFRDISAHVQAREALRDADKRKDVFLATLSHELRNPLAPIRTAARVLESPQLLQPDVIRSSSVISRQVAHMASLLDDLLDVSRITRGVLTLKKERVQLRQLLDAAVEAAQPLIDSKQHTLQFGRDSAPLLLEVDSVRFTQVVTNLLTNAAKYTNARGLITLESRLNADYLEIVVRDTGIGLQPQMLTKVFDMFAQVEPSQERTESGLGIGLALVKGLVELHGGSIEACSAGLNQGSEFTAKFPRSLVVADAARAAPVAAPGARGAPRRRILIADDNLDGTEMLALLLEMSGGEVHVAHSGMEALELAGRIRPDVAVLDIGMPGLNGYQVAARIRGEVWGGQMTLIAVTGWGQEEDKRRAMSAGFNHHLIKPVDPVVIERLIADSMGSPMKG